VPTVQLSDGTAIHYLEDTFTDPWQEPEAVVLLHGFCRNSAFWYAWVPHLARQYRVVRWDARGCGASPMPPPGFRWSIRQYCLDVVDFLDAIKIRRAHFIGESMGGMVLPYLAVWYPERVKSFVACSSNLGLKGSFAQEMAAGAGSMVEALDRAESLEAYIRATEQSRLAPDEVPPLARDWYAREWAKTPRRLWKEWATRIVPEIDLTEDLLGRVQCPVLIIAPTRTVKLPLDESRFYADHLPKGRLAKVDSASQGLAFAKGDECARLALAFLFEVDGFATEKT
jgi:3-oxoadipate enol-lactonase